MTTLTYDQNGNLASYNGVTYTSNYKSQLTTLTKNATTTRYTYDHLGQRLEKARGTGTTTYVGGGYEVAPTGVTKYIYAGGELVATIGGSGATTTTAYIHRDHLSSTNVTTNQSGGVSTVLDYYPYGSPRIESGTPPQRQYIGQYDDSESDLAYLNARYYDSTRGQFTSQDPVFWSEKQNLLNPQSLNSYSYAEGNPIILKDPYGRSAVGFGFEATGNAPAIYGSGSTYFVVSWSRMSGLEIGIVSSGEVGRSTSLGGGSVTFGLLASNANNISELQGGEAVFGASGRLGLDVGVDVGISKTNDPKRKIVTVTPSVGLGAIATPYALPVEIHSGAGGSRVVSSKNITESLKNSASSVQSSIQKQLDRISNQIKELQRQIDKFRARNETKKEDKSKKN